MKAIFSKAECVTAWIGPSNRNSDLAMGLISTFTDSSIDKELFFEEAESIGAAVQKSVYDLFRRPYWGRVWIIQELASGRSVQVRFGSVSVPLDAFKYFISTLSSKLGTIANYMSVTRASRLLKLVKLYQNHPDNKQRLIDILWSTVEFQASDQRDKIYAILGIAQDQDQESLPPDYSPEVTTERLLRYLVKHYLDHENDLDIFSYFPILQSQTLTDCSWLPDLSQHINGLCARSFNASSGRQPEFRFSSDMKHLTLKGTALATVDVVIGPFEFAQFLDLSLKETQCGVFQNTAFLSLKNAVIDALHGTIMSTATKSSVEDFFWKNIVGESIVLGADGPDVPCPCGYLELWESVLPKCSDDTSIDIGWAQPKGHPFQNGKGEVVATIGGVAKSFEEAINLASLMRLSGRCFFITDEEMIGLGPANLQKGDIITLIFGSGLPLALRNAPESFRLIGPAYVHGVMHGERFDRTQFVAAEVQEFTLS
jgi:hypothetical protein